MTVTTTELFAEIEALQAENAELRKKAHDWELRALGEATAAKSERDLLLDCVRDLDRALKACAPSWLPSAIRDIRRSALDRAAGIELEKGEK